MGIHCIHIYVLVNHRKLWMGVLVYYDCILLLSLFNFSIVEAKDWQVTSQDIYIHSTVTLKALRCFIKRRTYFGKYRNLSYTFFYQNVTRISYTIFYILYYSIAEHKDWISCSRISQTHFLLYLAAYIFFNRNESWIQ